jgi:hypothetical protein
VLLCFTFQKNKEDEPHRASTSNSSRPLDGLATTYVPCRLPACYRFAKRWHRHGCDALRKLAKEKKISEGKEKRQLEQVPKISEEKIRRMEEPSAEKLAKVMQV